MVSTAQLRCFCVLEGPIYCKKPGPASDAVSSRYYRGRRHPESYLIDSLTCQENLGRGKGVVTWSPPVTVPLMDIHCYHYIAIIQ